MKVNIGIIGCGYWGKNLIRNFIEAENAWLSSAVDVDKEILGKINKRYPSLKVYEKYEDLFRVEEVNTIAIATPADTHYSIAKDALLAGKHVLVEKPFVCSVRQAGELIELAQKKSRVLMVDHTFLFTGATRKIKELVETNELGDILYYDSVRINLGLFQKDVNVVWDLAPHDISLMCYLLDKEPASVSAIGVAHLKEEMENIAYLTLNFEDNTIAHFHFNWLAPVKVRLTLIGGTEKMIVYDDTEPSEKVKIYDKKVRVINPSVSSESEYKPLYDYRIGDMWAPKVDLSEALAYMCKEFVDSIIKERQPLSNGAFGLKVVKILEAAQKSIENNGKKIKL